MRCRYCDYCDSTPSIYHSSLAGVRPRRISYDEVLNEFICDDCNYYMYDEKKEPTEGEVETIDE